jgi:hypothetical protein
LASPDTDAAGNLALNTDAAGWDDLLATMEADLAAILDRREAGDGDRETTAAWNAPSGLGPMPEHLAPRAQQLLADLGDGMRRLDAERTTVSDHLAVLRTLPATSGESRAVYLDVTG